MIEAGLIPRMVDFLRDINRPDLQFEAAWVVFLRIFVEYH